MAEREIERDLVASNAEITAGETERLRDEIKQALTRLNAVLVAHYYTDDAVQPLAEETGVALLIPWRWRFGASVRLRLLWLLVCVSWARPRKF